MQTILGIMYDKDFMFIRSEIIPFDVFILLGVKFHHSLNLTTFHLQILIKDLQAHFCMSCYVLRIF